MGVKKYNLREENKMMKKDPLQFDEKEEIADDLLQKELKEQQKLLNQCLDKILAAHRNSKMLMVLLTGPCLMLILALKYCLKVGVLMYLYKSKKGNNGNHDTSSKKEQGPKKR